MTEGSRFHTEQSGVVAYRTNPRTNELEFLLVTSSTGRRWVIPKGHLEHGLTPAESAALEAFEEAGVEGRPERSPLGHYEYQKWDGHYRVAVYLFEVERELDDWPEAGLRRRRWVSPHKARNMVAEPALRDLLRQAERAVATAVA